MATRNGVEMELTGVHLCCWGCVNAADNALTSVEGVDSRCDMEHGTITITASDGIVAQQGLDALALAGFYGHSNDDHLAMRAVSDIPPGKVKNLNVSGIHNCCGPCCQAIREAIATVEGITDDTAKPGATSFEVTGDFHAPDVVKALNRAGFSARVKQ
jgi:periplasmic mercuric ion binding protein